MAWRSSGRTNSELVSNLVSTGIITSTPVARAMASVDRAHYVSQPSTAYFDTPQPIGYGATISAPHMHAHALQNLAPFLVAGNKVLDVGSGSGYCLAVFHHLVSPGSRGLSGAGDGAGDGDDKGIGDEATAATRGKVVGIEHIGELVDWSKDNLVKDGLKAALDAAEIQVFKGDGRMGRPDAGPFDAIHVGAASPQMPQALVDQLHAPGRMFIPVDSDQGYGQDVWQVDKDRHGNVHQTRLFGVNYVPLTDEHKQRR
ncbi:uncharacterized protein PFL1_02110 [Pseudozyma flocculosa PF-1]|uniref:protein-L-isoaspartate(D-aspartate) O-methyltransferase n=1 Tax=Pseudozyma flocculosa TaxID=84751 RepID=A0A5C3F332_9BASI|nr:uncharacterized protein PFL1_02110 [Pseudozyma flocculosa PF-1]EPQ30586.1 hypothetical protein PFL1_02110 [Pseudozyma flocculosa PF-1]SPO37681.1 related to l-isoaspartyl protein carboxyl methyltransferase [Pseudozyma flocculosa]